MVDGLGYRSKQTPFGSNCLFHKRLSFMLWVSASVLKYLKDYLQIKLKNYKVKKETYIEELCLW
jgi:hypothetical protein